MNLDQLQAAFDANPQSAAYHELVTGYVGAGRMVDALIVAQQAVQFRPQDVAARRLMGWVMLTQNQIRPAMQAFAEALQQSPSDSESRFLYSLCLERLGETDQAKVQLGYVLQAVPNHSGATEALARLAAGEEPPPPQEDKTVMMSLEDVVSSKTYTGSFPSDELDEVALDADAAAPEEAQPSSASAAPIEPQAPVEGEPSPKAEASASDANSPANAAAPNQGAQPSTAQRAQPSPAPQRQEAPRQVQAGPLQEPVVDASHQGSPLVTVALTILVAALLFGLHHFYGAWAQGERDVAATFKGAERAFLADGALQLKKAAALAQKVLEAKPENDQARGLAAHALARLEVEYGLPGQLQQAEALLKAGQLPLKSLHGRAAQAMVLRQAGKHAEAKAALNYTTPDGRKISVPMFRRERALIFADQGQNKAALDELNKALEKGGTRRDLLLVMAHFQLHRGTANAAFSYATRMTSSADRLHQEVKRSQAALATADQAEKSSKEAIPALKEDLAKLKAKVDQQTDKKPTEDQAKTLKALATRLDALERLDRERPQLRVQLKESLEKSKQGIPKLENAPALLLRAASLSMRENPAVKKAMGDLDRALTLKDCDDSALAPEFACISKAHRQRALAMKAALAQRIGDEEAAKAARKQGSSPDGISLLIEARTAMDQRRFDEAKAFTAKASAAEPQSALPQLLQLDIVTRSPEPTRDDAAFTKLIKAYPSLKARGQLMAIERSSRAKDLSDAQSRIQAYQKDFPSQTRYARYLEGRANYFSERYPEALKIYEEVLEQAIGRGDMALGHRIMVSMMRCYGKMRRVAPMKALLKDILADNPRQAEALYIAAVLLRDQKAEKTLNENLAATRWNLALKAR